MKLTVKEWNLVLSVLEEREEELDQLLEHARSSERAWIKQTKLEECDWNQDEEYQMLSSYKDVIFHKWSAVHNVLERMEEQEF